MILVDTNILLRLVQPGHPHQRPASDAMDMLRRGENEQFSIAPQNLYEMYVVCTRPIGENGLGMSPSRARAEIADARSIFMLLPDTPQVYPTWEGLVAKHDVRNKPAHDVRLVAFMIEHRVPRLLTFNDADFGRYAEIRALNPFDVLGISHV